MGDSEKIIRGPLGSDVSEDLVAEGCSRSRALRHRRPSQSLSAQGGFAENFISKHSGPNVSEELYATECLGSGLLRQGPSLRSRSAL